MIEEWKDIKGYDTHQISNLGNVRSREYIDKSGKVRKPKQLKPSIHHSGYLHVKIFKKDFSIHRLVALHFLDNPNNYEDVNHIDEDKTNNVVSNLEWCTTKYNVNYGTRTQRQIETMSIPIIANKDGIDREFKSTKECAKELGLIPTNITQALKRLNKNGTKKTLKGYTFKYKEVAN